MNNNEQTIIDVYSACSTFEQLRKAYISLIRKFHPDKGGDTDTCKLVNTLYEQFANKLKNIHEMKGDRTAEEKTHFEDSGEIDDKVKDVIFTLSVFPLDLEICGSWLWVTGQTWLYSKQLKACGCIFASKKKAWCFHVDEWNRKKKHKLTLDEIRDLHGSVKVSNSHQNQISRG